MILTVEAALQMLAWELDAPVGQCRISISVTDADDIRTMVDLHKDDIDAAIQKHSEATPGPEAICSCAADCECFCACTCRGDRETSLAMRRSKLDQAGIKSIVQQLRDTDPSQDIRERAITASNRCLSIMEEPP